METTPANRISPTLKDGNGTTQKVQHLNLNVWSARAGSTECSISRRPDSWQGTPCRACGGTVKVIACIEDPVGLLMSMHYYLKQMVFR